MATESTVLLVHTNEPPQKLSDELEKRGVFVEMAPTAEVEGMLTVVEPDLVICCGSAGAADVVALLAQAPRGERVRCAVVSERAAVEEMRKLDRSVVSTVLPDDLPEKTLVDRVVQLAARSAAPPPLVPRPQLPPRPALGGRAATVPTAPKAVAKVPAAALPAAKVPPAKLPAVAPATRTPEAPGVEDAESGRRLVLVDDDVTRAEAVAAALRQKGYSVQSSPADPARTRWLLLRRFAPGVIVTDSARPPQNWLRHLQSDEVLKGAQWIAAPYARMFDETSGAVSPAPLLERIAMHSSSSGQEDEDDDRPTLVHQDEDEEDRPTLIVDETHREALAVEARRSLAGITPVTVPVGEAPPSRDDGAAESFEPVSLGEFEPSPDSEPEIEDLDSLIPESLPPDQNQPNDVDALLEAAVPRLVAAPQLQGLPKVGVPATEDNVVVRSSLPGAPPLLDPPRSKRRLVSVVVASALLLGGGAIYAQRATRSSEAAATASAVVAASSAEQVPTAAGSASAEPASTQGAAAKQGAKQGANAEAAAEAKANEAPAGDPWRAPEDASVPRCERQGEYAALPENDAGQAGRFFDKARNTLVLGDWPKARDLMCRAVLIDAQSLALEGLAESYLRLGAPSQAKHWGDLARAARPNRVRTVELLGDIESQVGEAEQARVDWIKALGVPVGDQKTLDFVAESQVREATTAFRGKDLGRAEILFRRAATLSTTNPSAAAGLARTLLAQGRKEQAATWTELAAKRAPEHPDVLVAQGDLAQSQGDTATARSKYESAIAANPAHYVAREQLAKIKP